MPGEVVRTPVDPVARICQGLLDLTKAINSLADHVEHMDERLEAVEGNLKRLRLSEVRNGEY